MTTPTELGFSYETAPDLYLFTSLTAGKSPLHTSNDTPTSGDSPISFPTRLRTSTLTSFHSTGSSHILTATSRLETILKANRIPFKAVDCATDEKARRIWSRRSKGRKLPGLVKKGEILGDLEQVEEWNEFGEIKGVLGGDPVPMKIGWEKPPKASASASAIKSAGAGSSVGAAAASAAAEVAKAGGPKQGDALPIRPKETAAAPSGAENEKPASSTAQNPQARSAMLASEAAAAVVKQRKEKADALFKKKNAEDKPADSGTAPSSTSPTASTTTAAISPENTAKAEQAGIDMSKTPPPTSQGVDENHAPATSKSPEQIPLDSKLAAIESEIPAVKGTDPDILASAPAASSGVEATTRDPNSAAKSGAVESGGEDGALERENKPGTIDIAAVNADASAASTGVTRTEASTSAVGAEDSSSIPATTPMTDSRPVIQTVDKDTAKQIEEETKIKEEPAHEADGEAAEKSPVNAVKEEKVPDEGKGEAAEAEKASVSVDD